MAELVDASDLGSDRLTPVGVQLSPRPPEAGVAHLVERQPSKLKVAGSSPVARSIEINRPLLWGFIIV